MSETVRYVRAPAARLKEVGGTSAVYLRDDRALHVLNPSARLVFDCLERPTSLAALALRLSELTGVERGVVERDLLEVLPDFVRRGLVERLG
ncbi:MAG: PqqD family protein [Thermoanaerobaculia bacterium]|nr:PqqD family protein [Thermoanaerobaculia bacterium]